MKVTIEADELYPYWFIAKKSKLTKPEELISIPKDKIEWIENTFSEFEKVQVYLENTYKTNLGGK